MTKYLFLVFIQGYLYMSRPIRVRFAPSPTGIMHLGNVRTALLNFLFAKKNNGAFVLRIEDTDPERNFDPGAKRIIKDLRWLGISYDEGPYLGGSYAPYSQSERTSIYQEKLEFLQHANAVYRCFCTPEELEKKRQRAIALKIPPRYDRLCLKLSPEEVQAKLEQNMLFVWRFKVPLHGTITITDMAHGPTVFESKNFSDFPLTRADGSFTFLFSNAIDDILMDISHVLRGADHLSNTANQALIFTAFNKPQPLFWHLPIICNVDGKKLSKRDFGFALENLQEGGFLPEAIVNYLAIIGLSVTHEIMDISELIQFMNYDNLKPTGNIRYDVEKLRWVNHKWIQRIDINQLLEKIVPFLQQAYPQAHQLSPDILKKLIDIVRSEMTTLDDVIPALHFYFVEPAIDSAVFNEHILPEYQEAMKKIFSSIHHLLETPQQFVTNWQEQCRALNIPSKISFTALRLLITGQIKGPSLVDIITVLGKHKTFERLKQYLL